jgi:hypothetical protein
MPRHSIGQYASTGGFLACALAMLCLPSVGASAHQTCRSDYVCIAESSDRVNNLPARPATRMGSERAAPLIPEPCAAVPVRVADASLDEHQLICAAAHDAIKLLERCKISPSRPFQVQIADEVRHPLGGAIFGFFDSAQEKVLVAREASVPDLVSGTPYADLPRRDFYKSLIVHEVVHAVLHQNLVQRPKTHAAYEYPAYAMQIESLPSAARDSFLQSFSRGAVREDFVFTDNILLFDPFFFAARAYEHFKASPDSCGYLKSLLLGEAAFIEP